jgi:hypothetical protein
MRKLAMALLATVPLPALAIAQPPETVPIPEGHREFGPPVRSEVLQGWETFIGDAPIEWSNCAYIGQPMIVPTNPPQREIAVAMLSRVAVRRLSESAAARLIGAERRRGQRLSTTLFERHLDEMRQRKHRAEVERRDSWSVADQRELERLTARFESGDHGRYRPYLVRAVSKFGDGHHGPPMMYGDLCDGVLRLMALTFSYTIPPSVRVPAVVFLPRPPQSVVATVNVSW